MKKLAPFFFLMATLASGQLLPVSPSTSVAITDDAASVVLNPAGLGPGRYENFLLLARAESMENKTLGNDVSFYSQSRRSGFGFTAREGGKSYLHWGSAQHLVYGLYLGSTSHFSSDGYEAIDLGLMYRGLPRFSGGLMWKNLWSRLRGQRQDQYINLGLALRPLGDRLTIAYDHRFSFTALTFEEGEDLGGVAQLQAEILDGLKLFASYDVKSEGIQIGVGLGFGEVSAETYHDTDPGGYVRSLVGIQISEEIRRTLHRGKASTFVQLSFDRPITDSPTPRAFFGPKTVTLKDLVDEIGKMSENPEIAGIILKPDLYATGISMMEEVRGALLGFKEQGKAIYAFMDVGTDVSYALASVADSIFINSGGIVIVDGLAIGIGFLKGLFDKIGVEAQFYRRGDYKTAAEPYTREDLTETSREAYKAVLEDIHEVYSRMIMEGRGWSREELKKIYDGAMYTPEMAVEAGLVEGIFHPDQIAEKMKKITGEEEVKIVGLEERPRLWAYEWKATQLPRIALIYAEGAILPGKSKPSPFGGDKIIGSETTAGAIRRAREDKSVKAIVMRVNSPGGSVLASEDIWREVHRTTHPDSAGEESRKPFIVSMAGVAGSGGYYISCAADTIVAESSTITGSIGVLSGKISFGGLFEKIGYKLEVVKEEPHAEQFSGHRPFTEQEGNRMQAVVDSYYEQFLSRAAEGRGMSRNEVDSIAQGRIWSGADAKQIGLVDELGGLDRALEIAREAAGLEEDEYQLTIHKGLEEMKLKFELKSRSDLIALIDSFETEIPISKILDRAKMIHDEPFLFLMDGEIVTVDR